MNHLIITNHARERYIQRVADRHRYRHLHNCHGCATCDRLENDSRLAVDAARPNIDRLLRPRVVEAMAPERRIADPAFLKAATKLFPGQICDYYREIERDWVIYVIKPGDTPKLITVLTDEIIEEMSLRVCDSDQDYKTLLKSWKRNIHGRIDDTDELLQRKKGLTRAEPATEIY